MNEEQRKKGNRLKLHLIVGAVLSTIIVIASLVWFSQQLKTTGEKLQFSIIMLSLLAIPFGTIGYFLTKLWHDWFNSHFVTFTRNPIQLLIFTYIVDPLVGVVGFIVLGYYGLYKVGLFDILEKIL